MTPRRVAAVQMNSGDELGRNLQQAGELVAAAAAAGAQLVVLPENFGFMSLDEARKRELAETPGAGPQQDFLADAAARHGLYLIGGTLPLQVADDPARVYASCRVYDPQGRCLGDYHKIHLFDVRLPGGREAYRESAAIAAGKAPLSVDCGGLRVGLSVCYDLRFPELYRHLAAEGAQLLVAPAAFTSRTGAAHWEVLLRARAIENLCWMVAPNQCGSHPGGRRTWGHSMIVDPWGEVLAAADDGSGLVLADIDLAQQRELRQGFPCLDHRTL